MLEIFTDYTVFSSLNPVVQVLFGIMVLGFPYALAEGLCRSRRRS
jgi:hypothetical protein